MSIQKTCQNCQKEFIPKPKKAGKFCCQKCSSEYVSKDRPKYICKQCSKEFIPKSHGCIDFCSVSCSTKFNNIERAKNGFTTKNKTKTAVCIICGEETEIGLNASTKTAKCKKCKPKMYCKVCGSTVDQCLRQDICKKHQFIPTLVKLGLDETSIGSIRFYDEYFKIKEQIANEYLINKMSMLDLMKKYDISSNSSIFNILKQFGIKSRSTSEASTNAIEQGKLNNRSLTPYPFKSGFHISWFGQEFLYRSSYELKYAQQLDKTKTIYQIEPFKIKYFDSTKDKIRIAIPDFYLPETNTIVEIKSNYTLRLSGGIQNMKDRFKAYKEQGYNPILQLDHEDICLA